MNSKVITSVAVVLTVAIVFAVCPFLMIWAINTLFPAASVPVNFWTWLAGLALFLMFKSGGSK